MPRISDIEILRLPEQAVLYIRQLTTPDALPYVISKGYERLSIYLESIGGLLSDVPFVTYCQALSDGGQADCTTELVVEMCFPLPASVQGDGVIKSKILPVRDVVCCMVLGPYSAIGPVYAEMTDWIQERGYVCPQTSSEYYYNGQGYSEAQHLTRLMMPLARREVQMMQSSGAAEQ